MPKSRRQSIPSGNWKQFHHLAIVFKDAGCLAQEFEYWNAAGVLIVHSAIAFTDALTVKIGGVKSRGDDHYQVGRLVQEVIALDLSGKRALRHFFAIIGEKSLVSYSGKIYGRKDINSLWKHLERKHSVNRGAMLVVQDFSAGGGSASG